MSGSHWLTKGQLGNIFCLPCQPSISVLYLTMSLYSIACCYCGLMVMNICQTCISIIDTLRPEDGNDFSVLQLSITELINVSLLFIVDSHKIDQAQHAHSSEVSLGVISLESNVSPLFSDPGLQFDCWHQQVPQLMVQIIPVLHILVFPTAVTTFSLSFILTEHVSSLY